MKNYKLKLIHATFIIAAVMVVVSCMSKKPEDTKEVAEEQNEQKFEDEKNEKDAQFLVDAAEISREEISLGQLAQQKGSKDHLIELGKMMEEGHTKSLADLTAIAKIKNISLPSSETEDGIKAYKKLDEKSGIDFVREYCDMMVNGHKKAIALFENASIECTDPDIKAWAIATLPTLRKHLDHSMVCLKEFEKK